MLIKGCCNNSRKSHFSTNFYKFQLLFATSPPPKKNIFLPPQYQNALSFLLLSSIINYMLFNVARNVQICTLGRQNNLYTNKWHNTGGPTPQVNTPLSTYITKRENQSFEDISWLERGIHLCKTRTTIIELRRWPKTLLITHLQCSTEFSPQTA